MQIQRLSLWIERLVRIRLRQTDGCCRLAQLGIVTDVPPTIHVSDRPNVRRIKEGLLAASEEAERIRQEMAGMEAEVIDFVTLEVLLPGGPEPGSFLSWMPGEPRFAWWRIDKDLDSPRRRLPEPEAARGYPTTGGPTIH